MNNFKSKVLCFLLFFFIILIRVSFSQVGQKTTLIPQYKLNSISLQKLLSIDYFNKTGTSSIVKRRNSSITLRVMGIRVSFQPDTVSTTTGNGTFNISSNDSTVIDPPPHDREYFLAQLTAASRYYKSVSNGKLILTGDVYPLQNNQSYGLPQKMEYYNPNTTEEELNIRQAELFRDAILAANEEDQILFSEFDIFVVFHAGVGQDFSSDFDLTPNDIPSTFLSENDLRERLGNNDPAYGGIVTSNGIVKEGIILPETQNQEDSEFALKGTFVLLLGNQLGLPSLFNTDTGQSGVGAWGLMDAGASNYFGLIPAQPTAWSKVFLGWEEPILLEPGTGIQVAVSSVKKTPRIFKIPINAHEYFLIENRSSNYNKDDITFGFDQFGHRLEFDRTGRFTAQIDTSAGERLGVITSIEEYDFAIPGSGILVWHIDDRIIEENYNSNRINADPINRGVDLEEADGSQDIGQTFGFLSPGSGSEFGVLHDAFYSDNEIHILANQSNFVSFSPTSNPSSRSNSGAQTFITLSNFSSIDSVMKFDYSNSVNYANFPARFSDNTRVKFPPTIAELSQTNQAAIFFTPGNNQIFAWDHNGNPFIPRKDSLTVQNWDGNLERFQLALFDTVQGNISHPIVVNDRISETPSIIYAAVDHEKLIAWSTNEIDLNSGFAKRIWEKDQEVDHMLVWQGNLVVSGGQTMSLFSFDGTQLWEKDLNSQILSFCKTNIATGQTHLAVLTESSLLMLNQAGSILTEKQVNIDQSNQNSITSGYLSDVNSPSLILNSGRKINGFTSELIEIDGLDFELDNPVMGYPVLADIDHDGFGEIILSTQKSIWVFNHNGTLANGFPVELDQPLQNSERYYSAPLVLLTPSSGNIFAKNGQNDIIVIDEAGNVNSTLFYSGGGSIETPNLSLADLNNDGTIELIDANSDGFFHVRKVDISNWLTEGSWLQARFDANGSSNNTFVPEQVINPNNELVQFAYNYPNPTEGNQTTFRFLLQKDAQITISIYDLAGESITKLETNGTANVENEVVWPLTGVSSGVYMARLLADDGKSQDVHIIKVAVVK